MSERIKVWELALLFALCISLCEATVEVGRQSALSDKVIRLHVIASSDAQEAQELKLRVRDAVTELLTPLLARAESAAAAREAIEEQSEAILTAASKAAEGENVELLWGRESYGCRQTENYALPAGEYDSLRIVIGEGEGRNWWGVIFPQLDSGSGYAEAVKLLEEDELALIYEEDGYELRFRFLEILERLRMWLDK